MTHNTRMPQGSSAGLPGPLTGNPVSVNTQSPLLSTAGILTRLASHVPEEDGDV
jgi:hypothetical protein